MNICNVNPYITMYVTVYYCFICIDEDDECQPDAATCVTEVSTNIHTYAFIVTTYCCHTRLLISGHS